MAQFKKIFLFILLLATVVYSAELAKYHKRLTTRKFQPLRQRPAVHQKRFILARQEAVTPYPTADELKPEIGFEEGNTPDEVYGPPDETYGAPEINQTPVDQLPSEEVPEEFASNPDAEEFQPAEEETVVPTQEEQISRLTRRKKINRKNISSRLVQKKKTQNSQRLVVAPTQVIAAPASVLPVTLPFSSPYRAQSQQYYFSNRPFAYTAHYQAL